MTPLRTAAVALGLAAAAACAGDRPRPGPPSVQLELPVGKVITSPDTFTVAVRASDDNGLDSVVVFFLDQFRSLSAFNRVEVSDIVFFFVPEGRAVGDTIDVRGLAVDLVGERTVVADTLTVVADSTGGTP
jgi:hypothetical protein